MERRRTPTPSKLCAALLPLVGIEVRAEILGKGARSLVTLCGRFNGSLEVEPFSDFRLTLDVDQQLIRISFAELRGIRAYTFGVTDGLALYGVSVALAGGVSLLLEPNPLAMGMEL